MILQLCKLSGVNYRNMIIKNFGMQIVVTSVNPEFNYYFASDVFEF